jgi:hypothetical protein
MPAGPRIMTPSPEQITVWLARWREGDQHARDQVFGVMHSRLREIAANLLQGQRAIIHWNQRPGERVVHPPLRCQKINYNDRGHFFAVAAQTCGGSSSTSAPVGGETRRRTAARQPSGGA